MRRRAVIDEVERDALDKVRWDREADADAAGLRTHARPCTGDRDVDADDLAVLVEERAARIAWVDGRVGLDDREVDVRLLRGRRRLLLVVTALARELPEVERAAATVAVGRLVRVVVRRGGGGHRDAAVERAHDAVGDSVGEPEGCADRDGQVADVERARVRELEGLERPIDLDDGEVRDRVRAHELPGEEPTVVGLDADGGMGRLAIECHDVRVRHDVTVLGEDDAGTRSCGVAALHRDRHDRRAGGCCDRRDRRGVGGVVDGDRRR